MPPISWRRNLYIIVAVEFAVLVAYGFTNPFMPFFIQDLGNFTDSQAAFWSGVTTAAFGLAMFVSGPIWGIIADRWGRKPMVLRAMFGVAALSVATALSPNVYWVIIFRGLQGLFSGTVAAASAMVSASSPRDKIPFAMGLLAMSTYAGNTLGPVHRGPVSGCRRLPGLLLRHRRRIFTGRPGRPVLDPGEFYAGFQEMGRNVAVAGEHVRYRGKSGRCWWCCLSSPSALRS